ncbi:MAG: hypothetical protein Q8N44_18505 [Rubrivivax sp.]|nr:hypothetical protein [Rubrivivax sp.]MDP3085663.1 hypothetical protein [Rubrivivax sp.]
MKSLEQLCALPQAGTALLVAHRWLAHQPNTGATAFELLASLRGMAALADELPSTLDAIAANDARSHALLSALGAMVAIGRLEAMSKSLGLPLNLPQEVVDKFQLLLRKARGEGGAA